MNMTNQWMMYDEQNFYHSVKVGIYHVESRYEPRQSSRYGNIDPREGRPPYPQTSCLVWSLVSRILLENKASKNTTTIIMFGEIES